LIKAIGEKKKITLPRLIYALGIRNIGEKTAEDLATRFGSLEKIKKASLGDLQRVADIGPIVSESIYKWFSQKRNINFLEKLGKAGIEIVKEEKSAFQPLKGKLFVLTGTLESMSREKVIEKIKLLGGKTSDSISKKTDFLVVGKEPGSKYEKAQKLGVRIIEEKEFLGLIK